METPGRKLDEAESVSRDIVAPTSYTESAEYDPDSDPTLQGGEQNPTRVCMFRFGLLAKMQSCHLVDKYTFLPAQSDFIKSLQKNRQVGALVAQQPPQVPDQDIGGATDRLIRDITANGPFGSSVYATAAERCQSVGGMWMIAGCAACNQAMNRHVQQSRVIFYMQEQAHRASLPLMTDTMNAHATSSKSTANVLGGLIQKLTLYFKQDSRGTWVAREPNDILETNYMHRIAANLNNWGVTGNFRFRVIAILYASLYIRHQIEDVDHDTNFESWHIHRFRSLYSKTYGAGTFFGMSQPEAAATYTLVEGARVSEWIKTIGERICPFIEIMQQAAQAEDVTRLPRITDLERQIEEHVRDEQTLFVFAARHWKNVETGLRLLLGPLMYNVKTDPSARMLRYRASKFEAEMRPILRKLIREETKVAAKLSNPIIEMLGLRL